MEIIFLNGQIRKRLLSIVLAVSLYLFSTLCYGQNTDSVINAASVATVTFIEKPLAGYVPVNFDVKKEYTGQTVYIKPLKNRNIAPEYVSRKIIFRFNIGNTSDSVLAYYLFPGLQFTKVNLYSIKEKKITDLEVIKAPHKDNVSYRMMRIPPHDTISIVAEIFQAKTYTNVFRPRLIAESHIMAYINELPDNRADVALFTYIFCGLLIMMVLFSLANYFQGSNREFLYYAAYAIFLGYLLFTKPFYYNRSNERSFFYETYLDFILQCVGICFYMAFMIRFLGTKKNFPFLHKLFAGGITGLIAAMILYTWLHYGTDNYFLENFLENYITKGLLLMLIVIFLVYASKQWGNRLLRYLSWGNLLYLIFSVISLAIIIFPDFSPFRGTLNSSLLWYETGLFLELVFFLMGLTYKNRKEIIEQAMERERLKMENERKEMEKQIAVMEAHQEERERISADMHDELGSGMTSIRLMSEIAKNKMKDNIPVEIEKISSSANDLLNKMNAIIWSMNSGNDSVDNLVSYIRAYALEYLDGTSISCRINTPATIPAKQLGGDKRRNIFLCVKETLNNALKHSKATEMQIDIDVNNKLRIKIADNGVGIDVDKIRRFGNGLKNISRRMQNIGGTYSIENNGGTETRLELPL